MTSTDIKERLIAANSEAENAAASAWQALLAERPNIGQADTCGAAFVYLRRPSYEFQKAGKDLKLLTRTSDGRWLIGRYRSVVQAQTLTGDEVACEAAKEVLAQHFPEYEFHVHSYVD